MTPAAGPAGIHRFRALLESEVPHVPAGFRGSIARQYELFGTFGRKMALSSDLEPDAAIRHVREAAWTAGMFEGPRVLDIGAGGGYPTVTVAILRPDIASVDLCERSRKKAAFLEYLVAELRLAQCHVHAVPLETLLRSRPEPWSTVTARALGRLEDSMAAVTPFVAQRGKLVLLLGAARAEELAAWLVHKGYDVHARQDPSAIRRVVLEARRISP